jgi:hypothetical protein
MWHPRKLEIHHINILPFALLLVRIVRSSIEEGEARTGLNWLFSDLRDIGTCRIFVPTPCFE